MAVPVGGPACGAQPPFSVALRLPADGHSRYSGRRKSAAMQHNASLSNRCVRSEQRRRVVRSARPPSCSSRVLASLVAPWRRASPRSGIGSVGRRRAARAGAGCAVPSPAARPRASGVLHSARPGIHSCRLALLRFNDTHSALYRKLGHLVIDYTHGQDLPYRPRTAHDGHCHHDRRVRRLARLQPRRTHATRRPGSGKPNQHGHGKPGNDGVASACHHNPAQPKLDTLTISTASPLPRQSRAL